MEESTWKSSFYPRRITVPSGAIYTTEDVQLLQRAYHAGSIEYRDTPFRLKSGVPSNVYVFLRGDLTDHPKLLEVAGRKIVRTVRDNTLFGDRQPNLIGLPTAGTALAISASIESVKMHHNDERYPLISSRIMREKLKKTHGANDRWVNGAYPDLNRFTFWTVDNVMTDGGTKIDEAKKFDEDGYPSKDMPQLVFIDRQQGAMKRLSNAGFKRVIACYLLLDITFVYSQLGLWPKETVKKVEEEIMAHQFL